MPAYVELAPSPEQERNGTSRRCCWTRDERSRLGSCLGLRESELGQDLALDSTAHAVACRPKEGVLAAVAVDPRGEQEPELVAERVPYRHAVDAPVRGEGCASAAHSSHSSPSTAASSLFSGLAG